MHAPITSSSFPILYTKIKGEKIEIQLLWLPSSGLSFDESQEAYDFQFAKWMMKEKVI